jgi:hypothetical protein
VEPVKSRRACDYSEDDERALQEYVSTADTLIGLVLEVVRDNPAMLLSPIIRQQVTQAAERMQRRHNKIALHLAVDNPASASLRSEENIT